MPPPGRRALWTVSAIAAALLVALVAVFVAWPEVRDDAGPAQRTRARAVRHESSREARGERRSESAARAEHAGVSIEVPVLVLDRDGRPVAGAIVEVRAEAADYARAGRGERDDRGDDWGDSGGDDDDDGAAERDFARETVASGTAGADGIARVHVWADAGVVFRAHDDQGRHGTSDERFFDDEHTPETVRIEIDSLAILRGRVSDSRGKPVAGARVEVWALAEVELDDDSLDEGASAVTGADGRYRFELAASGAFDVDVSADGYQDAEAPALQALAGRETLRDFILLPAEAIGGTVLDPDGKPAPDVRVMAVPIGKPAREDGWDAPGTKNADSGAEGRFRFPDLAPGTYIVVVEPDEGRPVEAFDVRTGTTDLVMRLGGGGRIRATVSLKDPAAHEASVAYPQERKRDRDEENEDDDWGGDDDEVSSDPEDAPVWTGSAFLLPALPDQPVAVGVPRGRERESPSGTLDRHGSRVATIGLDANGNGAFTTDFFPAGTYDLLVRAGSATGQRRVTVTEGGVATVAFALPEATASGLEGTVRNADGKPFLQCVVTVVGDRNTRSVLADAEGHYVFPYLVPGDYVASAQGPLEGSGWGVLEKESVTVPPIGHATLDLVVPTVTAEERERLRGAREARPPERPLPRLARDEEEGAWKPDVRVREADADDPSAGWVIVTAPTSAPRLLGGDRIVSIDGTPLPGEAGDDVRDLLYGEKDSLCRIRAKRPSTGETLEVALPRVVNRDDDDEDGW